jgi:hypothetical protein
MKRRILGRLQWWIERLHRLHIESKFIPYNIAVLLGFKAKVFLVTCSGKFDFFANRQHFNGLLAKVGNHI